MKLNRLIVLLVVFAMLPFAAFAQETEGDGFVLELSAQLAALGWDDEALTEFKEAAGELDWSGATNADPQLLAWAFDSGMPDDALTAPEQVHVALALAERTGELLRLGYAQRDVAEAAMQATRTAVGAMMATQLRNETGDTELRVMIQARLNDAIEEQIRAMTRTWDGNASGSAYRVGTESDPGDFAGPPGTQAGPRDNSPDPNGD